MTTPNIVVSKQNDEASGLQIESLDDFDLNDPEAIMLYGLAGSGKTWWYGGYQRLAIINTGRGLKTLRSPSFIEKFPNRNPIVINLAERFGADSKVEYSATLFDNVARAVDLLLDKHHDKFDVIALDDGSEFHRGAQARSVELNQGWNKSSTLAKIKKAGQFYMEIQDYGTEKGLTDWFYAEHIPLIKQAGKHFVVLYHEFRAYGKPSRIGEEPPLLKIHPAMTGVAKTPDYITRHFDHVLRLEAQGSQTNPIYRTTLQGSELVTAKCRWAGLFKPVEDNLNLEAFLARINKHRGN